jgi:hypothetical protein
LFLVLVLFSGFGIGLALEDRNDEQDGRCEQNQHLPNIPEETGPSERSHHHVDGEKHEQCCCDYERHGPTSPYVVILSKCKSLHEFMQALTFQFFDAGDPQSKRRGFYGTTCALITPPGQNALGRPDLAQYTQQKL